MNASNILYIFPPNVCFSFKTKCSYFVLHVHWVIMQPEELVHTKQPCFDILWLLHFSMKCRWIFFLELIQKISTVIPIWTRTRVNPISIASPIRCIQESSIHDSVIYIQPVPTMRYTIKFPTSPILLHIANLKWYLSLQVWKTMKYDYINFFLFLLFLNDPIIICFVTPYFFLQNSQCVFYARRVPNKMFLILSTGRTLWTVVYHSSSHLGYSLPASYIMLAKLNHKQTNVPQYSLGRICCLQDQLD